MRFTPSDALHAVARSAKGVELDALTVAWRGLAKLDSVLRMARGYCSGAHDDEPQTTVLQSFASAHPNTLSGPSAAVMSGALGICGSAARVKLGSCPCGS